MTAKTSVAIICAVLVGTAIGCSSPAPSGPTARTNSTPAAAAISTVAAPAVVSSDTVRVPDFLQAIRKHHFKNDYGVDPDAVAKELEVFVADFAASHGLKAELNLQSVVLDDAQDPKAGTIVPRGSTVSLEIGFGD
jgi:hypothetical protein